MLKYNKGKKTLNGVLYSGMSQNLQHTHVSCDFPREGRSIF